jgi:hypothetical protein
MVDLFWEGHYSYAEVARRIGTTRQNVYQRCLRGSIPSAHDADGNPGVPVEWVKETLELRNRGVK